MQMRVCGVRAPSLFTHLGLDNAEYKVSPIAPGDEIVSAASGPHASTFLLALRPIQVQSKETRRCTDRNGSRRDTYPFTDQGNRL